jgi:UDPglucose--hexose-1-phosphate uridylyltransferase
MPQLRFDQTTGDWVVFAPLRKLRPHRNESPPSVPSETRPFERGVCPFCAGNESLTAREIAAIREGSGGPADWRVRVIPNKFPALMIEENPRRCDDGPMFWQMGGCGAHEVVIESPDHERVLAQQPIEQVQLVLEMLQRRYRDLMRDRRFQSFTIFKNHGEGAGTSLRHPH